MTTNPKILYLIGSLRNKRIPKLAKRLRKDFAARGEDVEVFEDWYAAGFEADDWWKDYEVNRGRSYKEALSGYAAKHVFDFDKHHLDRCSHAILVLPAGKSGHMEVMYAKYGAGRKAAILLDPADDPRYDVMYKFVNRILERDDQVVPWVLEGEKDANETTVGESPWDDVLVPYLDALIARGRRDPGQLSVGRWSSRLLP